MKAKFVKVTTIYEKDGSVYVMAGDDVIRYYEGTRTWTIKTDYAGLLLRFLRHDTLNQNP